MTTPKGVLLYFGGLHSLQLGPTGKQVQEFAQHQGWRFVHHWYASHKPEQAQEGFTIGQELKRAMDLFDGLDRQHKDQPIVLVGSSFGGWLATLLASQRAANGLILLNPSMNFISGYLERVSSWRLVQWAGWFYFAYLKPFRYYIPLGEGAKRYHFIPQSLLREAGLQGYDVLAAADGIRCPVLLVTPPLDKEGFLVSGTTNQAFVAALRQYHVAVSEVQDEGVGHGGGGGLSSVATAAAAALLARAAGEYK